jgi:hypothetical protein
MNNHLCQDWFREEGNFWRSLSVIPKILIAFALCGCALGQASASWPCQSEIHKADPNAMLIRVSDRVMNGMADTKVMPDISDLKGKDLDSLVIVQVLIGPGGVVRCFQFQEGDSNLAQRSLDAAQKWHYRPYMLNGQAINVETWIRFSYKKDTVDVVLPDR